MIKEASNQLLINIKPYMANNTHKPVLIIIAGLMVQKTTITSRILQHEWLEDSLYINPDNVAQNILRLEQSRCSFKSSSILPSTKRRMPSKQAQYDFRDSYVQRSQFHPKLRSKGSSSGFFS